MSSFWKYALFKFLRIVGIFSMIIGLFGGLIAYGNHLTDGIILASIFFIGGVLLTWYSKFKLHTGVITRGIKDARTNQTDKWRVPKKQKSRKKKYIIIAVSIILSIIILLSIIPSILPTSTTSVLKVVTSRLYFQSTLNDLGGGGNFVMTQSFPNGEQKVPDLWHHSNSFLSPNLKQNTKLFELTFLFYHKITSSESNGFTIKVMLFNTNTGIQTICTQSVTSNKYSRTTSCIITFKSDMPQLLQSEKLYIQIDTGLDWYWGSSEFPSYIIIKGVPQNEGKTIF